MDIIPPPAAPPPEMGPPAEEPRQLAGNTAGEVEYQGAILIPAGFRPRLLAFAIDFAVLSLLHEILLLLSGIELPGTEEALELFSLSMESLLAGGAPSQSLLNRISELNAPVVFSGWLNVALCAAYFTVFHGLTGQTLGKLCLGIRALRGDGAPLGLGWAFARYLLYFLSSRLVYTAWFIPIDAQRRTLYDLILKTNVFKTAGR